MCTTCTEMPCPDLTQNIERMTRNLMVRLCRQEEVAGHLPLFPSMSTAAGVKLSDGIEAGLDLFVFELTTLGRRLIIETMTEEEFTIQG